MIYNAGMSRGEDKANRWRSWRPRFTVRTLAIVVTLVCAYFGAWESTKRYGFSAVKKREVAELGAWASEREHKSPLPFLILSGTESYAWRRVYLWIGVEVLLKENMMPLPTPYLDG